MINTFMRFHVKGEVAETLLLNTPNPKLLIDLSPEPALEDEGPVLTHVYPTRVSFTLSDPELIEKFRQEVAVGDLLEAAGTFSQCEYTPHRSSHIDTTFRMLEFHRHQRAVLDLTLDGRVFKPEADTPLH